MCLSVSDYMFQPYDVWDVSILVLSFRDKYLWNSTPVTEWWNYVSKNTVHDWHIEDNNFNTKISFSSADNNMRHLLVHY